jgi:hypothetical protein
VRLQADDKQGGESIDGLRSHEGWIAMRDEEVVLTEWTPDPDYGWGDTLPEHRDRLSALGMRCGILCALAELWKDRSVSPTYSIAAMSALFSLATNREGMTRDEWDRIARLVEGDEGAKVVASVWEKTMATGTDVPSRSVDDAAEPEPEPEPEPGPEREPEPEPEPELEPEGSAPIQTEPDAESSPVEGL